MHAAGDAATAELRQLLTADGLSGRITLTTDIWTSENGLAFMVVTAQWVMSDFRLEQAILDFRPLEKELEEVIVEWGLAAGVGAAGRGAVRGDGYRSFQAELMAEMAAMEAVEGVQQLDKVNQYVAEGRHEDFCPLVY
ncbi:unnamed protein product [Closterium sp. Naga37s-1]|nr:unnamed protein product [Closterium sp. Naga37s-1]